MSDGGRRSEVGCLGLLLLFALGAPVGVILAARAVEGPLKACQGCAEALKRCECQTPRQPVPGVGVTPRDAP